MSRRSPWPSRLLFVLLCVSGSSGAQSPSRPETPMRVSSPVILLAAKKAAPVKRPQVRPIEDVPRVEAPAAATEKELVPEEAGPSVQTLVGYAAIGVGAAMVLVSVSLGAEALYEREVFLGSGSRDAAARERADSLRTSANIGWVAVAVLGGVGVAALLTAPEHSDKEPAPEISALIGPAGVSVRGSF